MAKETSIIDIFKRMSYNDRETKNTDDEKIRELYPDLEDVHEMESIHAAKEAQNESTTHFIKENYHLRALTLLEIGRMLSDEANRLLELEDFQKKDYSLFIDYFNYYSSMCYHFEKDWMAYEGVVIVLSNDVPFFILGSVLSAAFAAGCPVIVAYTTTNPWFLLFLKQVFTRASLPKNFFTLLPLRDQNLKELLELEDLETKLVLLGNLDRFFHEETLTSFSFVRPNNTATIIFEFSDLSAAIDVIIKETWDKKLATMWKVSTVVVQESVYKKFLDRLKLRIDQLTDERERDVIKNSIISEEDQNRKIKDCVPVLKVLSCRTANEGVNFLNSYKHYLGTSIWSENSSQALEVASKLICKNIWINCHGIIEPSVPFQPSGDSGNVVFGGFEGILEYVGPNVRSPKGISEFDTKNFQLEETVLSAQKAFEKWLPVDNKWMYLAKLAESLRNHKELHVLHDQVIDVLSMEHINPVPRRCNNNFYIIHEKFPIGVIAILLESDCNLECLVYLITTAIALGNAVVLAVRETHKSYFELLTAAFNIHLPSNLLTLIIQENYSKAGVFLASNTIIQALWLYNGCEFPKEYVGLIKKSLSPISKRILFISSSDTPSLNYQCLNNKIIWLTKVDHFP